MSEIKALEKLRELACDINGQEIIDHMQLYPSCVFDGTWLDSWHREFDRLANAIQAEVDGRFMELPVDADGVPIHIGDMIEYEGDEDTYRLHARGVYVYEDGHVAVMNERLGIWYQENCRHVKPRTLEDVLNDLEGLSVVYMKYGDYASRVCELTDEMRELLGVDT